MLESPTSPLSCIVFDIPKSRRAAQEAELARHLGDLGYVEISSSTVTDESDPDQDCIFLYDEDSSNEVDKRLSVQVGSGHGTKRNKRVSRRWILEKKGRRKVEENHEKILQKLRRLR